MKRVVFLFALICVSLLSIAQTENGIVYSEHETIDKTKTMWQALIDGDEDAFLDLFADSVYVEANGTNGNVIPKEMLRTGMSFWGEFDNLEVTDNTPAYPDAIVYNEGLTAVQDWIRITGLHEATGVNLDLAMHCVYIFNDEGKINAFIRYFDPSVYDDIDYGLTTRENGDVYIYHPYIVTTRKLVNAYCAKDMETLTTFFDPECRFTNSTMKWGESISMEEQEAALIERFEQLDEIRMEQVGYPDCIYYEEGDIYMVYSWWNHISVVDGEEIEMPLMVALSFNEDGKIVYEMDYFSTNHME